LFLSSFVQTLEAPIYICGSNSLMYLQKKRTWTSHPSFKLVYMYYGPVNTRSWYGN
jgi:hypothetical protein